MKKAAVAILLLFTAVWFNACKSSSAPPATSSKPAADAVEQKLRELAGNNATNCGRVGMGAELKPLADCALQANGARKPFYVAYDLPGLTVALAASPDGKLYSVQAQSADGGDASKPAPAALSQVTSAECPAPLRVAQSGRVTCVSLGSMGMSTGGANPHGGMSMPPATGENPHGGMAMPPPGTPNPHGNMPSSEAPMKGAVSH